MVVEGVFHIQAQRFGLSAGLFGAVQHGNALYGFRQLSEKVGQRKRAKQMHAEQPDLLSRRVQRIHHFLNGVADRPHGNNHPFGIRRAGVVKQMVLPAGERADLRHIAFDNVGQRLIKTVTRLSFLEVDIRVLRRSADDRMIRMQRVTAEAVERGPVQQRRQLVIFQHLDFLNFVRGAETIEEVNKRDASLNRRQMRHRRQIHHLLHVVLRQHRAAGLANRHHVLVIAKNIQRIGRQRPGADVKDARQQFTGDFVHVGDHQQQPLGGRIGGGERPGLQRAVDRACRAGLRLHLH